MKFTTINEQNLVREFLQTTSSNKGAEFLSSLEWADIQNQEGQRAETLALFDNNQVAVLFNRIKKKIPGGHFFYLPRGPVFASYLSEVQIRDAWQLVDKKFRQEGVWFYRVESELVPPHGKKTIDLQPAETLILDLDKGEADLLKDMHQKTRYNIRLAAKKGVTVRQGSNHDFQAFWRLIQATGDRDQFGIHDEKHYQTLLSNQDFIKLFVAEYGNQVIAAGLFAFYVDKVTYLHGASDYQKRDLMAPYLLQWEVIKTAQANAYKYYDFYGISEEKWPGVTRFKLGFGGRRVTYPGAYDVILKKVPYYFYSFLRRLRRLL